MFGPLFLPVITHKLNMRRIGANQRDGRQLHNDN